MPAIDVAIVTILALAAARGLSIGLVGEAFSLAGLLAAAFVAIRYGDAVSAAWTPHLGDALPPTAIHALAAGALGFGTLLAVGLTGRFVRRSLRFVGLGFFDRVAGAGLGALEGAVVAALALAVATTLLAPGHPWLFGSRAVAFFERARAELPDDMPAPERDVAAPAPRSPR